MSYKALAIPEPDLLRQVAGGSETAFAELFHRYKYKLFGYIFKLTQSKEITEDVVQDVFLKLWQKKETLAELDQFGPYLFRIAQYHAINGFRRMATEALAVAAIQPPPETGVFNIEDQLVAKEIEQRLHEAIQKLPPQQQLVYRLSREEGLKHDEIARRLQISPSTVKNHMMAALRTLREQIDPHSSAISLAVLLLVASAFAE